MGLLPIALLPTRLKIWSVREEKSNTARHGSLHDESNYSSKDTQRKLWDILSNPSKNKVFVARNAKFFKSNLIDQEASESLEDLEIIQEEDTNPSLDTSLNHEEDDQEIYEPQSDINLIRRSSRTKRALDQMCLYIDAEEHELGDLGEPANYKAAL
ncbi:hypothetical protein Tco_0439129 [Tanacetum coccineum]